jgi:hypothetical protein
MPKQPKIFSGQTQDGKILWKSIEATMKESPVVYQAFYALACRCMDLEKKVQELEEKIKQG